MKYFVTEINAICPISGELKRFCGPNIPAISFNMAVNYCQTNGLGYCKVIGVLVAEIPCKPGTYDPDFEKMIDFEDSSLN